MTKETTPSVAEQADERARFDAHFNHGFESKHYEDMLWECWCAAIAASQAASHSAPVESKTCASVGVEPPALAATLQRIVDDGHCTAPAAKAIRQAIAALASPTQAPAATEAPSDRESFERYCKSEMIPKQLLRTDAQGDYPNPPVGEMWKAWKARGALQPVGEPVLYQCRWFDSNAQVWRGWEPLAVNNHYTQTMEQRIAEIEAHRYAGKQIYEVRALGVIAKAQPSTTGGKP